MIFLILIIKFCILTQIIQVKSFTLNANHVRNVRNSVLPDSDKDLELEAQRNKIKEMMLHAWNNYELYAWGKNELSPLFQTSFDHGVFGRHETGATIIDALDTLYLMNLTSEYDEGRNWIATEFSLDDVDENLSVFETNIRYVGGFLSLYALTGDLLYKDKAKYVADKLLPAFNSPTGIPYTRINFKTGTPDGGSSILSDFGTMSLEFNYLSYITHDSTYKNIVDRITNFLHAKEKPLGLYPSWLDPKTGSWDSVVATLGGLGDSFYEYLLKSWLQSGKTDIKSRQMFNDAMIAVKKYMIKVNPDNLTYLTSLVGTRSENKMEHLACFAGGMFGLAANSDINFSLSEEYLTLAKNLTKTCHVLYNTSETGLGPEAAYFYHSIENANKRTLNNRKYILRPETIESYFYMWRITHDPIYRDWAWEAVQALETHCRTPNGYSGIEDVYNPNSRKDNVQQSFFLAETLKYLYLIYSDDDFISLNEWVFNTEAHPLPILKK